MLTEKLINDSKTYTLLKKITRFFYKLFYNKIAIEGLENVPNGPVIFAPNHQNALMDALAIILFTDRQPVFMAKADIFENNLSKKILNFFRIIPIYRIRDGIENLNNNDETFGIALKCLMNNNAIGIMPEGTDIDKQCLRPLKKGISRIALGAQEIIGEKINVKIIPVGLHYSNYKKFRSNVHIYFGKPINVNDYITFYKENQPNGITRLKDKLANELTKLMVNIDNAEYYHLIYNIKEISTPEIQNEFKFPKDYKGRFIAEKTISDCLKTIFSENPETADDFKPWVEEYINSSKRLKVKNDIFYNFFPEKYLILDTIRYTLAFPLVFAGMLFNLIPAAITWLLCSRIRDTQYVSSFKYAIGILIFTIYYFIFLFFPIPFIIKVLIILGMPVLGILAYDYFEGLKIFINTIKFRSRFNKSDPSYSRLNYVRSQIVKKVTDILNKQYVQ